MIEKYSLPTFPNEKSHFVRRKPVKKQENFNLKMNGNKMLPGAVFSYISCRSHRLNVILYTI